MSNSSLVGELPVSASRRLEMQERLEYETDVGGDVKLEIRTSNRAEWVGTLSVETRIRRGGFKIDTVLRCRLGASLDPKYEGQQW